MTLTRRWEAAPSAGAPSQDQFALVGLVANPEGVVVRSNTPELVGRPFVLTASVRGHAVPQMELCLAGRTLGGSGVLTRS